MSRIYSAQQYDTAFKPRRLQNWEVPKLFPQRRNVYNKECYPEFVTNERGHLLPEYKCGKRNPFCNYIGTYALPRKITKDLAKKLGQFPRNYSVIKETSFTPCLKPRICDQSENQEDKLRKRVRKCIEDTIEKNPEYNDASKLRDEQFMGKVKECLRDKTNAKGPESSESSRILKKCMDQQLKGKDILNVSLQELKRNVKDCINDNENLDDGLKKTNKHKHGQEKEVTNKDKLLRQKVRDCLNQLDSKELDAPNAKDKIRECVKELKDKNSKGHDNKPREDQELRNIVKKCINENNKLQTDPKRMKDIIKDCVKKNMSQQEEVIHPNNENVIRDMVKECIAQVTKEGNDFPGNQKEDFKERVKKCVLRKEKPEVAKENMMREAVKDCIGQYKTADMKLDKAEFKDKIKRCVKENLDFRQAVRECIPSNFGKENLKERVKECAKAKMRDNAKTKVYDAGKGDFRGAVKDCIKENKNAKGDLPEVEFKNVVKACAQQKLKKN